MEKITYFSPAFDRRDPDPHKDCGVHGVELRMVLKGEHGAVQFVLYTNWYLPHVTEESRARMTPDNYFLFEPLPADLGYHSPAPMWEGQYSRPDCPYLDGKPCYYDGSGLAAEEIYKVLVEKGSDAVWEELEKYYVETFKEIT